MNIQTSLTFCGSSDHCLLAFCENLNANILLSTTVLNDITTNIRHWFVANSRVLITLFPRNKMLAVTEIISEKHCDKFSLRSHMLSVLNPLKLTNEQTEHLTVILYIRMYLKASLPQ